MKRLTLSVLIVLSLAATTLAQAPQPPAATSPTAAAEKVAEPTLPLEAKQALAALLTDARALERAKAVIQKEQDAVLADLNRALTSLTKEGYVINLETMTYDKKK